MSLWATGAERVDGWSLDKSQPVGNPRKGKNRGAKNAAGDESGRGGKRKHNRNRNRDEQNVTETEFQHENAGGEFVAEGEPQRKHGDKASKKAVKKNRNRAERRAGMSNPEAERRDYLFEHGDDRREERRKGDRRDGYGKNRYDDRRGGYRDDRRGGEFEGRDSSRDQYGKNRRNDRYGKGDKFVKRDRTEYGRNDDFGGRRQSMRNTRQGEGGKRIHRKNENRIVRDERSEGAKRHERRMIAKYGNTEGPNRRHSKKNRHNAPFRMKSGRR